MIPPTESTIQTDLDGATMAVSIGVWRKACYLLTIL